ncbi:DUF397 domain-containing protein [Streptomyces sp. NBC_00237]|uniref:DUF397 domain-containing protein n=1 Tax=Streptomyces sp. NBC_00237 TaxID=2975687 RepID=UPI00225C19F5|nr:DUF397 domain-containing protein [Streptomyces sp. NBC_00237]MCX5204130.1 DUF397 domain-containing protein [Streptomyces sp. NBC_00237]
MPSTNNWQKSSFSGTGDDNNCVELAASATSSHLHLRESEDPGVVLTTGPAPLHSLLKAVKRGLGHQA